MKTIDIVTFAAHSKKIPIKFLTPLKTELPSSWRILLAHMIDFYMVLMVWSLTFAVYSESIKKLLVTRSLNLAIPNLENVLLVVSASLLPLFCLTYFFFNYFMNHGQTLGMNYVNSRIQLRDKNFYEALKWAMTSVMLCFSLGLSYFITKQLWTNFKWKDYLYQDLMAYKEEFGIDLISQTNQASSEGLTENITKIAA